MSFEKRDKRDGVRRTHLCCGEEDVIGYVAHTTGYNTQSDSREDVGVVSLPGVEGTSISQRHLVERAPAGEDASALRTQNERVCVMLKMTSPRIVRR